MIYPRRKLLLDGDFDLWSVLLELLLCDERIVPYDDNLPCLFNPPAVEVHADDQFLTWAWHHILGLPSTVEFVRITFVMVLDKNGFRIEIVVGWERCTNVSCDDMEYAVVIRFTTCINEVVQRCIIITAEVFSKLLDIAGVAGVIILHGVQGG